MHKTDIEWADYTWNPLTGCLHKCAYCYAERLTKRFSGDIRVNLTVKEPAQFKGVYILNEPFRGSNGQLNNFPYGFLPTYHKYRLKWLDELNMGANIFVGSMADVFGEWVPEEIIKEIFDTCKKHPQHNYLFLTKNPKRYIELAKRGLLPEDKNMWYGTSVPTQETQYFFSDKHNCFISIEPLLAEFDTGTIDKNVDWVIIGAETGQRKAKVIPKKEWVDYIVAECDSKEIPVFMKDSLISIVGEENMRTDCPPGIANVRPAKELQSRRYDECFYCKKQQLMTNMVCLMYKRKRRGPQKKLCYVCEDCFKEEFGGVESEETQLQNDK